jgi:hypothetical protein
MMKLSAAVKDDDVFVTSGAIVGKTIAEIAQSDLPVCTLFLRGIGGSRKADSRSRLESDEHGDIVSLAGPKAAVAGAAGAPLRLPLMLHLPNPPREECP